MIDKNFAAAHVGICILELSKFHYDYVLKNFDNVKLLFTDTDSLVYKTKNGNVYEQCFKDKELFDFSGNDKNSIYFDDSNKKKLGKMKDEFNGNKIDRILSEKHNIGSYVINKVSLTCYDGNR